MPLVQKKTWRNSLPTDILLSAMSVLVVAQSSSEIPEGLMNNPVFIGKILDVQTTYKEPPDVAVISVRLLLHISAQTTDRVKLKSNTGDFIKIPIFSATLIQNKAQFLRHRTWNSYAS